MNISAQKSLSESTSYIISQIVSIICPFKDKMMLNEFKVTMVQVKESRRTEVRKLQSGVTDRKIWKTKIL